MFAIGTIQCCFTKPLVSIVWCVRIAYEDRAIIVIETAYYYFRQYYI
jgi:hypothetical protein